MKKKFLRILENWVRAWSWIYVENFKKRTNADKIKIIAKIDKVTWKPHGAETSKSSTKQKLNSKISFRLQRRMHFPKSNKHFFVSHTHRLVLDKVRTSTSCKRSERDIATGSGVDPVKDGAIALLQAWTWRGVKSIDKQCNMCALSWNN